ncbi:MAG: adenosylcobinamide-GDP ribazoletransferase [Acidimicrobiaceae bacterium]|nr:adenosylcobinamide-GDP ribazoletransferase [Acidimicrobiaceae bacterium]MYD07580.1 adenosylcobinamide-GDP ribazoletransferase [Acidimicrobiaceae bacterium]MYG55186.1 adenosylcobinamide-GDP ribazoletransferase [Acidimicrobiaceae bacterium]MYI59625.1 adenosylcobinamide-GDP ribazoletransferase [Acidimicrobiaceae bacterium]
MSMFGFRYAWAFLTRLPGGLHPDGDGRISAAVGWFPVVGAVIGAITGAAYLGAVEFLDPMLAAVAVCGLGAILTGGFHEDGLADTADALGGLNRDRRLEIMSDSRIGTFGALALILVTLGKVGALQELNGTEGLIALVAAHALGRKGALVLMLTLGRASSVGLGATYTADLPRSRVSVVVVLVFGIAALSGAAGLVASTAVLAVAGLVAVLARRRFGGLTGDVLGAAEQLGELAVLVALSQLSDAPAWF